MGMKAFVNTSGQVGDFGFTTGLEGLGGDPWNSLETEQFSFKTTTFFSNLYGGWLNIWWLSCRSDPKSYIVMYTKLLLTTRICDECHLLGGLLNIFLGAGQNNSNQPLFVVFKGGI